MVPILGKKDLAQQYRNEALLEVRLDAAIEDWHETQPPATPMPVVIEEPVNPDLQTGDSALLGGAISIHAPWERD
jgi:hypothetical protein